MTAQRPGHHGDRARELGADAYFAIVPEWVLWHPDLSAGAVRLFGTLQRRANEYDHAFPGRAWLAAKLGVSKTTVDRYIGELVAVGAVDKRRRWDPEAQEYKTSLYVLRMVSPSVGMGSHTSGATPSHAAADTLATPMVTDREPGDLETDHSDGDGSADEETPEPGTPAAEFLDRLQRRRARRQIEDPPEEATS